jgi:hypothetical protein
VLAPCTQKKKTPQQIRNPNSLSHSINFFFKFHTGVFSRHRCDPVSIIDTSSCSSRFLPESWDVNGSIVEIWELRHAASSSLSLSLCTSALPRPSQAKSPYQLGHTVWWESIPNDFTPCFWVSHCLSFFLSSFTAATYIFTAPTCTATIILLEPCALNVEFQHFILRFNKISLLYGYHWKKG